MARIVWTLILLATAGAAALAGSVSGTVLDPDGNPARHTRVVLIENDRSVFTDGEGTFRFDDVEPGSYHLEALDPGLGSSIHEIDVTDGEVHLTLTLNVSAHRERLVVTATRTRRGSGEVIQPVTALDRTALDEKMQGTIGETLAQEPGVSSTYFGPGSSRPIIRGQSGSRVRVLEDGLGVGDASTTSPDHAVSTEMSTAETVEILRGPATLLYGGSAVGGVVNVIDRRIPQFVPAKKLNGTIELRGRSAAEETAGSVSLTGGAGRFAWYLDGFARETNDYAIPGKALAGDPDSPSGTLPNSAVETGGGTVGLSWVTDKGYLGVSARAFDSLYGIPAELEPDITRGSATGGGIRIDMRQRRYDLRSGFDLERGPFNGFTLAVGVTDYEHAELEGAETGTRFFNDSAELRFELTHGEGGASSGVVGLQYGMRELEALGAEAFLPGADTDGLAVFAYEAYEVGRLRYEAGLRFETTAQSTEPSATTDPGCPLPRDRDFDTLSGSLGLLWTRGEAFALGASLSRAQRAPAAEELYSCGEHVATLSFERGDPGLNEETSYGLDLSLRKPVGRLTGELTLFAQRFDDYIFELDTGLTEPSGDPAGLPVFQFTQQDAAFRGFELNGLIELYHDDEHDHDLDLELIADYVRAELCRDGASLPRIPPLSLGVGLRYNGTHWSASASLRRYDDQTRTASAETETDGYTLIQAGVGYRFFGGGRVHNLLLRATNLDDTEARPHTSRLKRFVPLPGRDVSLTYRLVF